MKTLFEEAARLCASSASGPQRSSAPTPPKPPSTRLLLDTINQEKLRGRTSMEDGARSSASASDEVVGVRGVRTRRIPGVSFCVFVCVPLSRPLSPLSVQPLCGRAIANAHGGRAARAGGRAESPPRRARAGAGRRVCVFVEPAAEPAAPTPTKEALTPLTELDAAGRGRRADGVCRQRRSHASLSSRASATSGTVGAGSCIRRRDDGRTAHPGRRQVY